MENYTVTSLLVKVGSGTKVHKAYGTSRPLTTVCGAENTSNLRFHSYVHSVGANTSEARAKAGKALCKFCFGRYDEITNTWIMEA